MKKRARYYDGKGNELRLDEVEGGIRITIINDYANPSVINISEDELLNLIDKYDAAGKHVNHA